MTRSVVGVREVALRAGVSPATVSRVLNGSSTVKRVHRERVQEAIDALGYRVNRVAQNLRRQQAHMIGVMVSDIENPHFTEMVRSVENAAYRLGYRVLLCNTDEDVDKQEAYLEVLAAERVLGVVLSTSASDTAEITQLLDLNIPIVAFDRPLRDDRADSVTVDNVAASRIATRHLLSAGHTCIGLVSDPAIETGAGRLEGYETEMCLAGLVPRSVGGESRIEGGAVAAMQLMHESRNLSAIIAGNNLMAIGVLRAIRQQGLTIPDDIAFLTFDDPFWSEMVQPPLTAMAQPVSRMAECVVELLMDRLRSQRDEPVHRVFECELRIRESCGSRSIRYLTGT